jgi:D-arabinonate dehydratase
MTRADPIREIECFDVEIDLPRPLSIGNATVRSRSYLILRISTASGLEGVSYAFGRGLPLAELVRRSVTPQILGEDALRPERVRAIAAGALWPYGEQGLIPVALSAVDLALWDMLGKRAGLPVADLLGRATDDVPICGVGGYAVLGAAADPDEAAHELARYIELGAGSVKMTIGAAAPAEDVRRVRAVRDRIGPDAMLIVDAFRSFRGLEDGMRRVAPLAELGLAYLEDPFAESLAPLAVELGRRTGIAIGQGEGRAGHRSFRELIDAGVDVIRCDATVVGGVREFMAVAALASAHGRALTPHVHADIHVHLAAAMHDFYRGGIEYMLPDSGLDVLPALLRTPLEIRDGRAVVPDRLGFGLDLDWDAVREHARV